MNSNGASQLSTASTAGDIVVLSMTGGQILSAGGPGTGSVKLYGDVQTFAHANSSIIQKDFLVTGGATLTPRTHRFTVEDGAAAVDLSIAGKFTSNDSGLNPVILKNGNGVMAVAGASTYAGTWQIDAGTLLMNGTSTTTGDVVVNSGATLGGIGAIGSNTGKSVTIKGGATLAPGQSVGALTIGHTGYAMSGLKLGDGSASNATLDIQLAGDASYDQIIFLNKTTGGTGGVTLNGVVLNVAALSGYVPDSGDQFFILDNQSTVGPTTGTFANAALGGGYYDFGNGVKGKISYTGRADTGVIAVAGGKDIVIYDVVVPEPSSAGLLGIGAIGLLGRWRRRSSAR